MRLCSVKGGLLIQSSCEKNIYGKISYQGLNLNTFIYISMKVVLLPSSVHLNIKTRCISSKPFKRIGRISS